MSKKNHSINLLALSIAFVWINLIVFASLTTKASALPAVQRGLFNSGVRYYDAETQAAVCANDAVDLIGNDNIEKAYNFFIGKGLKNEQSAGIVGNLIVESGVNPTAFNPAGGGQGAFGIAQWRAGRQTDLRNFATQQDDVNSLELQLRFMWHELQGKEKKALDELQKTSTVEEAAVSFDTWYERSGGSHRQKRIDSARDVIENYAPLSGATQGGVVSQANCVGGNGANTRYVDGFTVYSQYDPAWKNLPYSSSTIGESGCGPAAMAMIITNLTGRQVNPVETANYAGRIGMYVPGSGSSWEVGPRLAENWGLKSEPLQKDIGAITAALRAGKLVITPGQGPKPFTSGGHFIVIRGITADGKFRVGDSGHNDTNDQDWDPQFIVSNMRSGGIYAIYE